MKKVNKLLALLLVAVMVLAMGTTAFATDGDDNDEGEAPSNTTSGYTLTITGTTTGHTYDVYQIFSGTVYDDNGTLILSDIEWGEGVNGNALLAALKASNDFNVTTASTDENGNEITSTTNLFSDCTTAADVAAVLGSKDWTAANTDAFVALLTATTTTTTGEGDDAVTTTSYTYLSTATKSNVSSTATSTVISGLAAGYYIVIETTTSVPKGETYTEYIVQVVGDTNIEVKSGTVTSDKEVKDTNDSVANSTSDWQETADHDIGDTIEYRLTGTPPENYADYDGYYYKFTDTLTKGLTLNEDSIKVTVKIGDTEYTLASTDYTVNVGDADADGNVTFTVTISDLKKVTTDANSTSITIDKDTIVYVYYTCTLNENAVLGSAGNPNTAYLTYSNNPNTAQGGDKDETGDTPEDTNIVFTYALVVNKVDENGDKLTGAGFTLYKWDASKEVTTEVDGEEVTTYGAWVAVGDEIKGDEMTEFTFKGLDDGKYKLVETTTPDGYNTMDDIYIVITAEHVGDDEGTKEELKSLTATFYSDEACTEVITTVGQTGVISGDLTTGTVTTSIVNEKGSELPSTGGMGTTMLYILGAILVVGAGVLLITRRRMSTEK